MLTHWQIVLLLTKAGEPGTLAWMSEVVGGNIVKGYEVNGTEQLMHWGSTLSLGPASQ